MEKEFKKIINYALYLLIPMGFFILFYLASVFATEEWNMFEWGIDIKFPFSMIVIMFFGWGVIFAFMINNKKIN